MASANTVASPPDARHDVAGFVETWRVCNCQITLVDALGQVLRVKSRRWDCPSCGRDKAKKVTEMCVAAGAERMWTGTFSQPRYRDGQAPERYRHCDPLTHVYVYERDESLRWRSLEDCPHCCAWSSLVISNFRKRLRRRWPNAQLLWTREVQPQSGSFTINMALTGVPVTRKNNGRHNTAGTKIRQMWAECVGQDEDGTWSGIDLGHKFKGTRSAKGVGVYVGKYLTKLAGSGRKLARGYRRWSRTAGFGPEVRMGRPPNPNPREGGLALIGWTDPFTSDVRPDRWHASPGVEAVWMRPPPDLLPPALPDPGYPLPF